MKISTILRHSIIWIYFLFIFVFLSAGESSAQIWSKTIGSIGTDYPLDIAQKSDGSFIVAGFTLALDPLGDAHLIKLNNSGNIVWQKTYGDTSTVEIFNSVRPTSDGGYIAAGMATTSPSAPDIFVVKVASNGSLTWKKRLSIQSDSHEQVVSVRQTSDGGFIIGGYFVLPFNGGDAAGMIVKLDSSGSISWQKRYEIDCGTPDECGGSFRDLEGTPDGGAVAVGVAVYPSASSSLWILKINSTGSATWQKYYQTTGPIGPVQKIRVATGGYILLGASDSMIHILKLDSSGNVSWQKLYRNTEDTPVITIAGMDIAQDGNIVMAGYSTSATSAGPTIVKFDSNGNLLWAKRSTGNGVLGESISKTNDNGFVLTGPFVNSCDNDQDFWIVKLDSSGNSCEFSESFSLQLEPVPTVSSVSIPQVVAAGLGNVTSNASASNTTAVQRDQCNPSIRQQTECAINFDIVNILCSPDDTPCIDNRKVLISKKSSADNYPSEYQNGVPDPKDRRIMISGIVTDSQGNFIPDKWVYFRVTDPPDQAPYTTPPNPYDPDNVDKSEVDANGGKLNPRSFKTNQQGRFETILTVTNSLKCTDQQNVDCAPSGDNYQVEGSFTDNFTCSPACDKTGIITAWKRLYLERDKMFRQGGVLASDTVVGQTSILVIDKYYEGPNQLQVSFLPFCAAEPGPTDPPCFQIGIFDAINRFDLPDSEKPWVRRIETVGNNKRLHLVKSQTDLTPYELLKTYDASPFPSFAAGQTVQLIAGKSAGLGVIYDPSQTPMELFYEPGTTNDLLTKAFDDAFIDVYLTSPDVGAMPYLPQWFFQDKKYAIPKRRFSKIWFSGCYWGVDWVCGNNNFMHLISIHGDLDGNWGITMRDNSSASFLYVQNIQYLVNQCTNPGDWENCKQFTTIHEIGHQFYVNPDDCKGHDQRLAWCANPQHQNECGGSTIRECPMYELTTQRDDGIERFDTTDLFFGISIGGSLVCNGEVKTWVITDGSMRKAPDPVPYLRP